MQEANCSDRAQTMAGDDQNKAMLEVVLMAARTRYMEVHDTAPLRY